MSTTDDNDNDQHGGSGKITSNTKECTSCDQNSVDTITKGISNIAILNDMTACACCGKEGNSADMNTCNKCKMVKYCNAACKKKHRTKHKKACEKRVAELHDEQLFKEPPPREECPICFLPLPIDNGQTHFECCCGKSICCGCIFAMNMSEGGKDLCPFCRTPTPSDEDIINKTKKLMKKSNGGAFHHLAGYYARGINGLPQDYQKANELLFKAVELGYSEAYCKLGDSYRLGRGVDIDMKKANYYYELAAMGGDVYARHNLGAMEWQAGNHHRALKHLVLAAKAGHKESLDGIKKGYKRGVVTKDEYAITLRAYQKSNHEMKSDARDKAAVLLLL